MKVNLLADIFNAGWETWQDIVFILMVIIVAGLLFFGIAFLLTSNARMEADGKRMMKRMAWYENQLDIKRRALELEKEEGEQELSESRKELEEKRKAADEAEEKANLTRQQLIQKRQELSDLLGNLETTQKELAEYQKRDGTNVPTDVIVNILTENMLNKSELTMDPEYTDCKIPTGHTLDFTVEDITEYINKKPYVSFTSGRSDSSFKYTDGSTKNGIAFVLIPNINDGKICLKIKCGPDYGTKLCKHLKGSVNTTKFPGGPLWFVISNENSPFSLEFIKLLIDISYRIAKVGY